MDFIKTIQARQLSEEEIFYIVEEKINVVFNTYGPGLFERLYQKVLYYELSKYGFEVLEEVKLPVFYDDVRLDSSFRVDLLINKKVVIELKCRHHLTDFDHKQIDTYLRLSNIKLGVLVNFWTTDINNSIIKKINDY